MVKVTYNLKQNAVFIEFEGKIDVAEAERSYLDIQKTVPKQGKKFKILTDLSRIESVDIKILEPIKKSMDFFDTQGVTEIIRVIPDPSQDIGFNILSLFHYSKEVKFVTVQSRKEAEALL